MIHSEYTRFWSGARDKTRGSSNLNFLPRAILPAGKTVLYYTEHGRGRRLKQMKLFWGNSINAIRRWRKDDQNALW